MLYLFGFFGCQLDGQFPGWTLLSVLNRLGDLSVVHDLEGIVTIRVSTLQRVGDRVGRHWDQKGLQTELLTIQFTLMLNLSLFQQEFGYILRH